MTIKTNSPHASGVKAARGGIIDAMLKAARGGIIDAMFSSCSFPFSCASHICRSQLWSGRRGRDWSGWCTPRRDRRARRKGGGRRGEQHTGNVSSLAEIASGSCSVIIERLLVSFSTRSILLAKAPVSMARPSVITLSSMISFRKSRGASASGSPERTALAGAERSAWLVAQRGAWAMNALADATANTAGSMESAGCGGRKRTVPPSADDQRNLQIVGRYAKSGQPARLPRGENLRGGRTVRVLFSRS